MINTKYSYKDFTGQDLSNVPASEFTGEIVGSCFFQPPQIGPRKSLPGGIECEFRDCNLGNVIVPERARLTGTTTNNYLVLVDGDVYKMTKEGTITEKAYPEALDV